MRAACFFLLLLWPIASASFGQEAPPQVADTKFSIDRGLYEEPFTVYVTTATEGAEIRYSLDGSMPDNIFTSRLYQAEEGIRIETTTILRVRASKLGWSPSNVDTQTYIFPNAVVEQPDRPAGFSTAWTGSDYGMDGDPAHLPLIAGDDTLTVEESMAVIAQSLLTLPTLSLVMPHGDLFGTHDGIYHHTEGRGREWERAVSVEWIEPDGDEGFQVDAGIRMQGFTSRDPTRNPKHSLRLIFRKEYGPGKLHFPLFGPEGAQAFDTLVLRSNAQDAWVYNTPDNRVGQFVRDEWTRRTQLAMGQPAPRGTWVHLYLNGLYWGVYNPTERPDASFMASYLGGEEEEYDVLKNHEEVIDGLGDSYTGALAVFQKDPQRFSAGYQDLSSPSAYEVARSHVDVESLIDYLIPNMYAAATDWPGNNYIAKNRTEGSGFRFFSWDNEHGMKPSVSINRTLPHSRDADSPTKFHHALKANEEYRVRFGDHLHRTFFNGGPLTVDESAARWLALTSEIEEALVAESARWGDYRREVPYTVAKEFRDLRANLLSDWFPRRSEIVLDQFRDEGLYPDLHAPTFTENDAKTVVNLSSRSVSIFVPTSRILYTIDCSDPRLPGGAISEAAQAYQSPVETIGSGTLKARVEGQGQWSALAEFSWDNGSQLLETFFGAGAQANVVVIAQEDGVRITFARRKEARETLSYQIETSEDLVNWKPLLESPATTAVPLSSELEQVTAVIDQAESFLRLKISTRAN